MSRSIGYARCSTTHQDTVIQASELRGAGCVEVFAEKVSSRAPLEKRQQLRACLETLQEGDELVVSKLDRLGRSQVEVINRLADLQEEGIQIRTLDGLINTRGLGKLAPLVLKDQDLKVHLMSSKEETIAAVQLVENQEGKPLETLNKNSLESQSIGGPVWGLMISIIKKFFASFKLVEVDL